MARILFASELGANLGHVGQLLPLACELQASGHDVMFALRDVTRADALLRPRGFRYLQAPVWHPRAQRDPIIPCSYSEILQHYGYRDRNGLLGMVSAWREIYTLVDPQVMLFEYAPTALFASRGIEVARVLYGVGFSSPPHVSPFPNFRTWEDVPRQRLEASDAAVLDTVNWVLERLRLEPYRTLQDSLDVDEEFLCTFHELDHYADRPEAHYCGSAFTPDEGAAAMWPAEGRKRIYVYLQPGMPHFQPVAEQLSDLQHSVLWVAPGLTQDAARRFESSRFKFMREPVRLSDVATQADAAVLHGGHGTVSAMLLAGVPIALFPMHTEQALVARNVTRIGAGVAATPKPDADEVRTLVQRVLEEPRFKQSADAFAAKYSEFDPHEAVSRIARAISRHCAQ